jgi:glucosyl-3-phosphoglycerate synthase
MNEGWTGNTFHHSEFADLDRLVSLKKQKGIKISAAFPTLNEEATITQAIETIKGECIEKYPLIDQVAVIDSGSQDRTLELARKAGVEIYISEDCLTRHGNYPGKGENLWKSLYLLSGDIILWLDADIKNIHPKFAYGLLGPLLHYDDLLFVKAFYQRPLQVPGEEHEFGGGRVTEILVRPLFSCFFPELAQLYQPCSGECAGRRGLLEHLPFASGYGIETGMLIDIYHKYGPEVIAQVNLDLRIHRNQPANALGKMGFEILHACLNRLQSLNMIKLNDPLFEMYRMLESGPDCYELTPAPVQINERPPISTIPEYQEARQIG